MDTKIKTTDQMIREVEFVHAFTDIADKQVSITIDTNIRIVNNKIDHFEFCCTSNCEQTTSNAMRLQSMVLQEIYSQINKNTDHTVNEKASQLAKTFSKIILLKIKSKIRIHLQDVPLPLWLHSDT